MNSSHSATANDENPAGPTLAHVNFSGLAFTHSENSLKLSHSASAFTAKAVVPEAIRVANLWSSIVIVGFVFPASYKVVEDLLLTSRANPSGLASFNAY